MVGGKSKRRKEIGRGRASKRGREKRRGATRRGTNTTVPLQTNSRGLRGLLSSVSIPPGVLERERTVLFGPSTLSGLVCKPRGPPGLFSTTTTTAESHYYHRYHRRHCHRPATLRSVDGIYALVSSGIRVPPLLSDRINHHHRNHHHYHHYRDHHHHHHHQRSHSSTAQSTSLRVYLGPARERERERKSKVSYAERR